MKNYNQTVGGISGIIEAGLYIFGFIMLFTLLQPTIDETTSGLGKLAFILEKKTLFQVWILFIYVVFGIVLIPLTLAINEHFEKLTTIFAKATPIFGFIWSGLVIASGMIAVVGIDSVANIYVTDPNEALTTWKTIEIIQNGLGGGVEIIGGLWVFLISVIGLQHAALDKRLNYLGLMVGGAGILTIIPPLKDLGAVFGLTQIVWFLWIGIVMMRKDWGNENLSAPTSAS